MSKRFWIENNEILDSGFFLSNKEEYVAVMNNLEDIAAKWQRKCADLEAKLAEKEEQLKNAVVLKPDRYVIVNNWWKKKNYGIAKVHQQVLDSYSIQTGYMGDVSPCLEYGEFATLEEAEAKLEELKKEMK